MQLNIVSRGGMEVQYISLCRLNCVDTMRVMCRDHVVVKEALASRPAGMEASRTSFR